MPKYTVVHLRDKICPTTAIHFLFECPGRRLTDDPRKVTCGFCRRMIHMENKTRA